jgi:pectate lyase/pectin methylesterase-like acyl-CoA thioesterase
MCWAMLVPFLLWGQDLNRPFGWASCNGGTTGSGILSLSELTDATPNVYRPTTEEAFAEALKAARKNTATTIVIPANTIITFTTGTKVETGAKNISILGEPGARFDSPSGSAGILNVRGTNVVIRNILFTGPGAIDVNGNDPLGIEGGVNVWVDHCTFVDGIDGNLDIKGGANYITVSWCKFSYTEKSKNHTYCNLVGHSDSNGGEDREALKVTFALNWWADKVQERMPRVRFGSVHCVNNLYRSAGNNYCIRAGLEANMYVDQNAFMGVKTPITKNKDADAIFVTMNEADNLYKGCSGTLSADKLSSNSGAKFNPYDAYAYTPVPKEYVEAIVSNSAPVEGYTQTTGAGNTLWSDIHAGDGDDLPEVPEDGGGNGSLTAGNSFFGETAPAEGYFWFTAEQAELIQAMIADGSISGTASHNATKADVDYTDHIGAIVLPKIDGEVPGELIFKLPSCAVFKLYLVRTGSFAGALYRSTDGQTWGEPFFTLSGSKGVKEVDCSTDAASGEAVYIRLTNTSSGGLNLYGADIRLAGKAPEPEPEPEPAALPQVWDFGAAQLNAEQYENLLTAEVINSWYPAETVPGTSGLTFPSSFTAGRLAWTGGSNDRLRTGNEALTRYDNWSNGEYTGRLYINGAAQVARRFTFTLEEDDEVTFHAFSQDGNGVLNFESADGSQHDTQLLSSNSAPLQLTFVAKAAGNFYLYDTVDKPSYARIVRKAATYTTVSGIVSPAEGVTLPAGYGLTLTNAAGKTWTATLEAVSNSYSVKVPAGYDYVLALTNAGGYIISTGDKVTATEGGVTHPIVVSQVALVTISGAITGLNSVWLSELKLHFTPADGTLYQPQPVVDVTAATYSVQLEPNVEYTLTAEGVNDYFIPVNKVTYAQSGTHSLDFQAKPTYPVTLALEGMSEAQQAAAAFTFANLEEGGYAYTFAPGTQVMLRDGVYSIACAGLDEWPVQLALTSNLKVAGAAASKSLSFEPIRVWEFADRAFAGGETRYNGLQIVNIYNEVAKGHAVGSNGSSMKVPAQPGDQLTATFYYAASFSIEGGETITANTSSGSTNRTESVTYTYTGTEAGFINIAFSGTTYLTRLALNKPVPYAATIRVGKNETYTTINDALEAIRSMPRPADERVTVLIEPGNYEEMLVIDRPNITLSNASETPSIALKNSGVEIDAQAVRITSYYGTGYNYYSQGTDNKWHADVLRVNKENGSQPYENVSGTTNASYWCATVVIAATGFEANYIIFENSFNQYISQKESEDVVVPWAVGGKGIRPTDAGNTSVQNRSFVERAAAIALAGDKAILNQCRVVGRQDSFFGAEGNRIAIYKGSAMGSTDYIFGGMTAVFYQTELAMNTDEDKNSTAYITAAQQRSSRGYLMYECTVTSAVPGVETAATMRSKPGYFGRPWQANTGEAVFFNTTIETSDFTGYTGQSLILPVGWNSSLGGESAASYEYGTKELSGEDNSNARASWATRPATPVLNDGTEITLLNFTKGSDGWDPFAALIANDPVTGLSTPSAGEAAIRISASRGEVLVEGITSPAHIQIFGAGGMQVRSLYADATARIALPGGVWIVKVTTAEGTRTAKVVL